MSLAVTKRKKSIIILAWVAPIVAIIISISMLYDHYTKIGNSISITLKNINGLDLRQSHIQFNGLQIGDIKSIKIDEKNINKFIVKANIYSDYNYLITKGALFYKVSPVLSLDGISGLSNILQGNYIELIPASLNLNKLKTFKQQNSFIGYDSEPKSKGVLFYILSNTGNFDITSSILYKGIQIGEVIDKSIDKFTIKYQVLIYDKYKYLISSKTQFYKINPLEMKASLENIDIKIPSLKNIISSAIGFITPSTDKNIKESYTLYDSIDEITLMYNEEEIYRFRIQTNNISTDNFIYYKGSIVGKIDKVKITKEDNIVYGYIKNKYKYLINNSTVFYKQAAITTKISLEGIKVELSNLKELIMGGITFTTPIKEEKLTQKVFAFYDDINQFNDKNNFTIKLNLENNFNIKTTSKLYYKNIEIGAIKDISLEGIVKITLNIEHKYKYLFGKNSKIYLQGTSISLDKIENLSSTILGDNLYLIPDRYNGHKSKYTLDSVNPNHTYYKKGLRVQLKAKDSKNLTIGSPIYFKGFEVGEIYNVDLEKNGKYLIFDVFIKEQYANILKTNSKFYKATIIDMDVGVFGAKIKLGSAKSMLNGGIFFTNPEANSQEKIQIAKEKKVFDLLDKKE